MPAICLMAISRPTSISFANVDGSGYLPDVHTFPNVITYSEFLWGPPVRWASDSASVGLAMPGEEPFLPTSYGDMWIIPADGSPATLLGTIIGKFYFNIAIFHIDFQTTFNITGRLISDSFPKQARHNREYKMSQCPFLEFFRIFA